MPKRVEKSEWRNRIYQEFGKKATIQIKKKFGKNNFLVKDLIPDEIVPVLSHCKNTTRHQYLTAICSALEMKGVLKRNGRAYYFS